jgi:hypothetical protein
MNPVLILADGAKSDSNLPQASVVELIGYGRRQNVRLEIEVFRTKFSHELPERLDDLLRIAAFVYSADNRVSRGSKKDVFADHWSRNLHLVLPVWDIEFWNDNSINDDLVETLQFLTGDSYEFEFTKRTVGWPKQGILQFKELMNPLPQVDTVILFSGGIDSLAATIDAVSEGCHPILVSHRPAPVIDRRQKDLVNLLCANYSAWAFPHISMWVNRSHDKRTTEFSQRSRSFLFTSLGITTACMQNVDDIRLCDNGVVSVNLPQSDQNIGTFLSRSTHPRYIELIQHLAREITTREKLVIRNTLINKTKKETIEIISNSGHPELLQETVSCGHTEGKTKIQPHCGTCTQCIDRRFAGIAASQTEHDIVERYEKDIFLDRLEPGLERTHAENYVRFAWKLESIQSADELFKKYPQLYDCLPLEGSALDTGNSLWELFQRHQRNVNGVLTEQIKVNAEKIRRGALSQDCLLSIIVSGLHTVDSRIPYVDRLRSLIIKSIPAAFQTQKAKNEHHVQDVGEAVFTAAKETLDRESPQIPFGVVSTKPDFSNLDTNSNPLFVEFKFLNNRQRLNAINTEMTSRVTIYSDQGAWTLFIVYDPFHIIVDDDKFVAPFSKHQGIFVGIIH